MGRWVVLALIVVLSGCAESSSEPTSEAGAESTGETPSTTPSPNEEPSSSEPEGTGKQPARPGATITTGPSEYGPMLFDPRGQAIYLFDTEASAKPECYGACATAWPPVLTKGEPVAAGDARDGLLGTTRRSDGSMQVTYAGHPLYFYVDEDPGQVLCHDIEEYGGLWLVVTPAGGAAPH